MTDISKLNRLELNILLKKLKLLNSLKKTLWNRWMREYKIINNNINFYKVEYYDFGNSSLSYVQEKSIEIFKKLFWSDIKIDEILFIPNQNLKWWMRISFNDNMYDLSYDRFKKILK